MNLKYYKKDEISHTRNYAYLLDGHGHGKKIKLSEVEMHRNNNELIWVCLDYHLDESLEILKSFRLDEFTTRILQEEETRPRSIISDKHVIAILRGINATEGGEPEDMVSVRVYIDKNLIITTRHRKLLSFHDMRTDILNGRAPKTSAEFFISLNYKLLERIDDAVEDIDKDLDKQEDLVSDNVTLDCRRQIADLRREAILIKRYISPQKDALSKIYLEDHDLFNKKDKLYLRECIDKLQREIEDLDSFRDRSTVIHEELDNKINEDMNNKLYLLSLITIIFLPITFLTGLFGVNLGGIPGAGGTFSFFAFCSILIMVILFTVFLLYKMRWFK